MSLVNRRRGRQKEAIPMSTNTPLCELLGIERPIVLAPLATDPRLPAAVSNAGGLGRLGLSSGGVDRQPGAAEGAPRPPDPRLPAAVSNAGGLGSLGLSWSDDAGQPVRETAALTDGPIAGNFVLFTDKRHR